MKKEIIFKYDNKETSIQAESILIPRIGETIDIGNLLETNEERTKYKQFKENGILYVMDIFHDISSDVQIIEITLSADFDFRNDFYNNICQTQD